MKFCPMCGAGLINKLMDAEERLACSRNCGYVHWNSPIPVVAGLIKVDGNFILARNAKWPEGLFSVITGFLESGEAPDDAIARETKEELGLTATSIKFLGHYPFPGMNQIIIGYFVDATGFPVINHEIAEVKVLPEAELMSYDFGFLKLAEAMVQDWQWKVANS